MPTPKHQFYRSLANNTIYPAMVGGAEGYEDEHPTEWQAASRDEYVEQSRREALLARRANVLDVTATTVTTTEPAPVVGLVPPPPSSVEA